MVVVKDGSLLVCQVRRVLGVVLPAVTKRVGIKQQINTLCAVAASPSAKMIRVG
jgi:hypothetical protein